MKFQVRFLLKKNLEIPLENVTSKKFNEQLRGKRYILELDYFFRPIQLFFVNDFLIFKGNNSFIAKERYLYFIKWK